LSRELVTTAPALHRIASRVHGAWTQRWWSGEDSLTALLGPAPGDASFDAAATRIDRSRPPDGWQALLRSAAGPAPADALVVLAGQQPVLAGGPALVAHKAATAIRLAQHLEERWSRPVLPVFLLATEDHDSGEVNHVDYINISNSALLRARCRVTPGADGFHRSTWDEAALPELLCAVAGLSSAEHQDRRAEFLRAASRGPADRGFSAHVANLLHAAFAAAEPGLTTVEAHRLSPRAQEVLRRALEDASALQDVLAAGASRATAATLPTSFDPGDPRPLLLESRDGRRRRLELGDGEAVARLARSPVDFSPHASLRPIVQAATLPVVAQVCGPSELAYLGQARGLHEHFGVEPPVLVPRLEATRVPLEILRDAGVPLEQFPLDGERGAEAPESVALMEALKAFADGIAQADPSLRGRAERLVSRTRRDAQRLEEALVWRGRTPPGRSQLLTPRGRPQDTVLAWLGDAWEHGDPAGWGRRIVGMAEPLDPPAHVLYVTPPGDP
jgi:hypothetical protein